LKRWRACAKAGSQGLSAKIPGFLGAGQTNADGTQQNSRAPLYLRFTSIGCQEPTYPLFLQASKRFASQRSQKQGNVRAMTWLGSPIDFQWKL
jgi:hypothetical protein